LSTATDVRLGIALGMDECEHSKPCLAFALPLFEQMGSGKYDECAVMELPHSREAWQEKHRTSRKRAWRAEHHGYFAARINRNEFEDDVWKINLSRPVRQGRPMSDSYRDRPSFPKDEYPCHLHGVHAYGVLDGHGGLVAYLWMYRAGDLALVSQVLGHKDHEDFGIMHLLFREALAHESKIGPGVCVYNRWDSGTPGLRQLKAWVGFEPVSVEWLP
jgi:hypothetical protein